MADLKIAAILRSRAYSPNHIATDAAILNEVAALLRKRGMPVTLYSEEELARGPLSEKVIISMSRERKSLEVLRDMEDSGALIINSPWAIENCKRENLGRILISAGVPYPDSVLTDTDIAVEDRIRALGLERCWVKRADFHSRHKEDITFASNAREAQEVVKEYFLRDIKRAVVDRHIDGNLVKFYGVSGTDFFHWYHFFDRQQNSLGYDPTDGRAAAFAFDANELREMAQRAADALGVVVYGGDAIVSADGSITFINFNDWPSFSPCRKEAAAAICRSLLPSLRRSRK